MNTEQELVLVRGISGSGKSTWCRLVQADNPNYVVVSRDDLRLNLFNHDFGYPVNEALVTEIEYAAIQASLESGYSVLSDNTNLEQQYADRTFKLGHDLNVLTRVEEIPTPIEKAKYRNVYRSKHGGRFVPEHVIDAQYEKFQTKLINPYA